MEEQAFGYEAPGIRPGGIAARARAAGLRYLDGLNAEQRAAVEAQLAADR